jgi:hypothetical protein
MAIQTVTINVEAQPTADRIQTFLVLSQNENGRQIRFRILGDELPAGCTATLSGEKPDGNVWSKAGTVSDNFVTVDEDIQMTAVAGRWDAQLDIVHGLENIVTAPIRITVEPAAVDAGAVPSDTQLEGYVEQCKQYAESAKNEAYGSPLTATTAAGMTDQSRVYVYTGSETGYTSGHWYYHNGSAWTDGGVYNAVAVDTDTTLSIAGKAADAKKTGDELSSIKEDFNDIEIDFYKNQFDKSKVTSGSYIRGIDGATITNASWNTSDYIPVWSGCIVLISKWYNSTTYGFAFYDLAKNQIYHEGLKERTGKVVAPENAKYIRVSVSTSNLDNLTIYVVPNQFYNSKALNPFYIQAPGEMINGNAHNAFPAICQFGGYEYVAFRSAAQHDTTNSYGGVVICRKEKNGSFVEVETINTGDWTGELRDPSMSVTRNGRYMLLSCFTTYTVSDVTHHDNVIIQLDTNMDVVGRYIAADAEYVYWGKTLETPTGHLLHAEYGSNKIILARSNEIFDGTNLSELTFTETEWNNGSGMAEPDIGYNDKYLFLIIRRGANNAVYKKTTDLEGVEGFDSSHSVGIPLHAPKLLAYTPSENYIVFVGAMYVSASVRKPIIAFYRVSDNTLIQYAVIKGSTKNGGYIDFCKTADHEYDVVWYDEPNLTTTTEINYEHLNLRECCPAINFIV